jgi:hypothetical protein
LAGGAFAPVALILLFCVSTAFAHSSPENAPRFILAHGQESDPNEQPQLSSATTPLDENSLGSIAEVKQSKRILWIFPNYRAVSANMQLPPLSLKEKFWLGIQDSFDYSSFGSAGILAGVSQATESYPEFGPGIKGYGRLFARDR